MSVNLLVAPTRPDADAGFIVLQADRAHAMSGSNCICVVTALLETGRVEMREPETIVRLDTPAGLITARAHCSAGRCLSVSLDNVPCFVEALDRRIETPAWGTIRADIAFGGIHYAIVDVDQVGLAIDPKNARALADAGIELKEIIGRQVEVSHPELPGHDRDRLRHVPQHRAGQRHPHLHHPDRRPRRPLALRHRQLRQSRLPATRAARPRSATSRRSRSIIGGEFMVEAIGETTVGGRPAVVPRITGQAWIYGREELRVDMADPFPKGFALSDTWGPHLATTRRSLFADQIIDHHDDRLSSAHERKDIAASAAARRWEVQQWLRVPPMSMARAANSCAHRRG